MNEDRFVSLQAVRQVVSRDDVALGVSQHATVQADFEAGEYGEEYLSIKKGDDLTVDSDQPNKDEAIFSFVQTVSLQIRRRLLPVAL